MAGLIKMPLGTEVGLSPGDIVLDGDQPTSKGAQLPPNFQPTSIVANGRPSLLLLSTCFQIGKRTLGYY